MHLINSYAPFSWRLMFSNTYHCLLADVYNLSLVTKWWIYNVGYRPLINTTPNPAVRRLRSQEQLESLCNATIPARPSLCSLSSLPPHRSCRTLIGSLLLAACVYDLVVPAQLFRHDGMARANEKGELPIHWPQYLQPSARSAFGGEVSSQQIYHETVRTESLTM